MEDRPLSDLLERMIAYISMEIGIKRNIPTYAGGLEMLTGDPLRPSADLNPPIDRYHSGEQRRLLQACLHWYCYGMPYIQKPYG